MRGRRIYARHPNPPWWAFAAALRARSGALSVVDELPRTANGKLDRTELVAAHYD